MSRPWDWPVDVDALVYRVDRQGRRIRRPWFHTLAREVQARPDLVDAWEYEFLLGLLDQQNIQPDQLSILSELIARVRSATP